MDPISIGLGVVGLGLQLFGGGQSAALSAQNAKLSQGIAADEQGVNAQKYQQMQLEARRSTLQTFRNAQRARAQGVASATNQGAAQGSGLQGATAQNTDQATFGALGINQNLQIGTNIFGINSDISSKRIAQAGIQGQQATDQGLMSLGQGIVKAAPIVNAFGKDLFGGTSTS